MWDSIVLGPLEERPERETVLVGFEDSFAGAGADDGVLDWV